MSQSRHVKVMSPKQRRANRRNAQRSTGPRTPRGRSRAAMNAIIHGIFCRDLLMPGEDPHEFEAFRDQLLADLGPRDFLERTIAEQYVESKWRLRRVRAAERDAHDIAAAHIETFDGGPFIELRQRMRAMPRIESMNERDRKRAQPTDDPDERGRLREQRYADRRALVPVSATMASSFNEHDEGTFERLSRYQYRLESSADRALRQLRQLRKERGPDWTPPDEVEQVEEREVDVSPDAGVRTSVRMSNAPVQNEPISAPSTTSHGATEGCDDSSCNNTRAMTPEIFHPAPVGYPRTGVAEAPPPLDEERS